MDRGIDFQFVLAIAVTFLHRNKPGLQRVHAFSVDRCNAKLACAIMVPRQYVMQYRGMTGILLGPHQLLNQRQCLLVESTASALRDTPQTGRVSRFDCQSCVELFPCSAGVPAAGSQPAQLNADHRIQGPQYPIALVCGLCLL